MGADGRVWGSLTGGVQNNVRIDDTSKLRCWNYAGKGFTEQRAVRPNVALGTGALATKKKLKCQTCGSTTTLATLSPFPGPERPKHRKQWEKQQGTGSQGPPHSEPLPISPVTTGCDSRTQEVLMREGIDGIRG